MSASNDPPYLEVGFDPHRGGFQIRDRQGPLLAASKDGHGGARLVGITDGRQLPCGIVRLPFRSRPLESACGARGDELNEVSIECDGLFLTFASGRDRLRLRVGGPLETITVLHEDFK